MKKRIYQWHRSLSIVIAVPVLFWAMSGFMHPLMTNIRPAIATQALPPAIIDSRRIKVPLQKALLKNHLGHFANFRLIHIDTNWFYQVQLTAGPGDAFDAIHHSYAQAPGPAAGSGSESPVPVYLSCTNGNLLAAGDWLYAQYIARQFLEGPAPAAKRFPMRDQQSILSHTQPIKVVLFASPANSEHDCCGAAADYVLNAPKGAKVANVSRLTLFDNEYKSINRLLPAYRVSFDRPDGIRIYVETTSDRFAFAMDNRRAVFDEIFRLFHTWGWLDLLGKGRLFIEMTLALLAFCTTLMGIYIFFITKGKKSNPVKKAVQDELKKIRGKDLIKARGKDLIKARCTHRYVAIVASLFTLLWTCSGSYHAFSKLTDDTRDKYYVRNSFASDPAAPDLSHLFAVVQRPITNISIVTMNGRAYWQVYEANDQAPGHSMKATEYNANLIEHKDLMKDGKVRMPLIDYISTTDYSLLPDGDARYAEWLATLFSHHPPLQIRSTTPVTTFGDEYNFTDKRLPVWKVGYASNHNERYYVETSTGKLSHRVDDVDMIEGYCFALFHKHHFMDWGGKSLRDISTMWWALAQVAMVCAGLILYLRSRRKMAGR